MDELSRLAGSPYAFVLKYVRRRPLSHIAIVSAVLAAVACSITTQYGVKYLVDALAGPGGSHLVWLAFFSGT
jgi:ATP-binding cassette subfamily B protein